MTIITACGGGTPASVAVTTPAWCNGWCNVIRKATIGLADSLALQHRHFKKYLPVKFKNFSKHGISQKIHFEIANSFSNKIPTNSFKINSILAKIPSIPPQHLGSFRGAVDQIPGRKPDLWSQLHHYASSGICNLLSNLATSLVVNGAAKQITGMARRTAGCKWKKYAPWDCVVCRFFDWLFLGAFAVFQAAEYALAHCSWQHHHREMDPLPWCFAKRLCSVGRRRPASCSSLERPASSACL